MAGKGGGAPIRTRKVTPGYDQAFTLPKGTSAAPIKQVALGGKFNTKALNKKLEGLVKQKPIKGSEYGKRNHPAKISKISKMPTSDKVAIGTAAGLAAGELGLVDKTAKGVDKIIHKTKKIFKPKDKYRTKTLPKIISDLKSSGSRVKYPKE
jgi:hypothetical protein